MATVNVSVSNTTIINTNNVVTNTITTVANTISNVFRIVVVGANGRPSMTDVKMNVYTGVMIKTKTKKT